MIGEVRYHVPRSQCFSGSRGGQRGNLHLHVTEPLHSGRLHRDTGALCGRKAWWDREPEPFELSDGRYAQDRCPRCVEMGERYGVEWPTEDASDA